ncbi:MAG: hypothetical protein KIT79_03465 [Deltaproteobacteria bacterium]|nr:hypothetical protein [Deltaproteobacteria bacterium]
MNAKMNWKPGGRLAAFAVAAAMVVLAVGPARAGGTPPPPPPPQKVPWYFTVHAGEINYDLGKANQAFTKLKDLGGKGVRTDVFWRDIEPARGVWDYGKLQFYTNFVSNIRWHGLEPLIIFSNAPDWAVQLYGQDKAAFWAAYERYIREVVLWIGDRVNHYQLWNEANHLIDPIDAADDWQLFARAGAVVRNLDPAARTYINVMANLAGWEAAVTDWLVKAGSYIDVIGIDHYPGTWACCFYTDWGPLDTLLQRINTPGNPWYGKDGAILETGYSSWAWLLADEYDQRDFISQALPVIRTKVNSNNATRPYQVVVLGWYQLIDTCTDQFNPGNCWVNGGVYGMGPEAHFGIIHSDYSNKVGYGALKTEIGKF